MLETAKCDAWATTELNAEEEIYGASHKFASYVDVVLSALDARQSLSAHQEFSANLVKLLHRAPETPVDRRNLRASVLFRRTRRRPGRFLLHFVRNRLRER